MERLIGTVISVGFGLINSLSTGGANRDDLRLASRPVFRLPIIAALAIIMLLGVLPATLPQSLAYAAASTYLADEIGQTEITVDAGDDFHVVLYVVDVSGVAGYECKITVSGPATATGASTNGSWFADGHSIFDGTGLPDYGTAMLLSPLDISGSGDVIVFPLHADEEGSVAINVDSEYFLFADSDGEVIEVDAPSTLYITVLEGDGLTGGEDQTTESGGDETPDTGGEEIAETGGEGGGGEFLDSTQYTLYVKSMHNSTEVYGVNITGTEGAGGTTDYNVSIDENTGITLTAPSSNDSYNFHHWTLNGTPQYPEGTSVTFIMTEETTARAVYGRTWYVAHSGGDFDNIQAAIDYTYNNSLHGDTVVVRSAVDEYDEPIPYTGEGNVNVNFKGMAITVKSENGPATSVIECFGTGQGGFIFHSNETNASILDGLTIKWASISETGVLDSVDASPTIINNKIIESDDMSSPAIWFRNSDSLRIVGNTIQDCRDQGIRAENSIGIIVGNHILGQSYGQGIYIGKPDSQPTPIVGTILISGNHIIENEGRTWGGGIFASDWGTVERPSIVIQDNTVEGNDCWGGVSALGGGIYCQGFEVVTISGNTFSLNTADAFNTVSGGGLYVTSASSVTISDNTFDSNEAELNAGAIGFDSCSPLIESNTFANNRVTKCTYGGGGAISFFRAGVEEPVCEPIIRNNLFIGNSVIESEAGSYEANGGAIFCGTYTKPLLENNTFHGNRALSESSSLGAALYCSQTISGSIARNCIFWENETINGSTKSYGQIALRSSANLQLEYSDLMGGWDEIDVEAGSTLAGGTGIIDCDPLFAAEGYWDDKDTPNDYTDDVWNSQNSDYHLKSKEGRWTKTGWVADALSSACIDAGSPQSSFSSEPEPNGDLVNLGRFGNTEEASKTREPVVSDVSVTEDGGTATVTWTTDFATVGQVKYGPVSLGGSTPNTASQSGYQTSHSIELTGISAGTNYKIVIFNNPYASDALYWPYPWPIQGDANMDCRVNILDLIFIRNKLNLDVATGDNWKADLNNDNRINILDLIFVRGKLNTQCP